MRESLAEISAQRAEQFLNTFISNIGTDLSPTWPILHLPWNA
jgi:hypothetical protein